MPGGESGRGTGGGGKRKGETVFFAPHSGTGPTMPADHQRIGFNLFQSIQPLPPSLPNPPSPSSSSHNHLSYIPRPSPVASPSLLFSLPLLKSLSCKCNEIIDLARLYDTSARHERHVEYEGTQSVRYEGKGRSE